MTKSKIRKGLAQSRLLICCLSIFLPSIAQASLVQDFTVKSSDDNGFDTNLSGQFIWDGASGFNALSMTGTWENVAVDLTLDEFNGDPTIAGVNVNSNDWSMTFSTITLRVDGSSVDGIPNNTNLLLTQLEATCNTGQISQFICGAGILSDSPVDWTLTPVHVVPIPPALYLFGSGALGLIGMARHKKA